MSNISKNIHVFKEISTIFGLRHAKNYLPLWIPGGKFIENDKFYDTETCKIEVETGKFHPKSTNKSTLRGIKSAYPFLLSHIFNCDSEIAYKYLEGIVQNHEKYAKRKIGHKPASIKAEPTGGLENILYYNNQDGLAYMCEGLDEKSGKSHLLFWSEEMQYWSEFGGLKPSLFPLWNEHKIRQSNMSRVVIVDDAESALWLDKLGILCTTWFGGQISLRKRIDMTCLQGKEVIFWPTRNLKRVKSLPDFMIHNMHNSDSQWMVDLNVPGFFDGMKPFQCGITGYAQLQQMLADQRDELPIPIILDEEKETVRAEAAEMVAKFKEWGVSWSMSTGQPKSTSSNVWLLLENTEEVKGLLVFDFVKQKFFTKYNFNKLKTKSEWSEVYEEDLIIWVQSFFERKFENVNWSREVVSNGLHIFKTQEGNIKNTLLEMIKGVKWDGTRRLDVFFNQYMGFPHLGDDADWDKKHHGVHEYLSLLGRKFICSIIHRLFEPGCLLDNIIVFQGPEGTGKSKFLNKLSMGSCSVLNEKINNPSGFKDGLRKLSKNIIVVLEELSAFDGCDDKTIKTFISQESDDYRKSYGRDNKSYKRTAVLVGTTNDIGFLPEVGENRRWLVVPHYPGSFLNFRKIELDAVQVYAEAYEVHYQPWFNSRDYDSEMPSWEGWCHSPKTDHEQAAYAYLSPLREKYRNRDYLITDAVYKIIEYIKANPEVGVSVVAVWDELYGVKNMPRAAMNKIGSMLKRRGYRRKSVRVTNSYGESSVRMHWVVE